MDGSHRGVGDKYEEFRFLSSRVCMWHGGLTSEGPTPVLSVGLKSEALIIEPVA
jgi:hypothetical protein